MASACYWPDPVDHWNSYSQSHLIQNCIFVVELDLFFQSINPSYILVPLARLPNHITVPLPDIIEFPAFIFDDSERVNILVLIPGVGTMLLASVIDDSP